LILCAWRYRLFQEIAANEERLRRPMARVVLADDHPLFLQALKEAVEQAGIEVVGMATRGDDLIELMKTTETDAVLLDLSMPGYDGFECIDRIRALAPEVALIVVSGSASEPEVKRALDSGALCFIGKSIDPGALAGAVRTLLSSEVVIRTPGNARRSPRADAQHDLQGLLTPRELQILTLTSQGLSNAEMGKTLWVTEQTIKFHLSNIYRKIGVANRTGASRWAQQHGLLEDAGSETA
jgi:DNA-binding NarL/FixJ family response regulator